MAQRGRLGRIVFYRESYNLKDGVVTMAAIVTKLGGQTADQVSLLLFRPSGDTAPLNNVEFSEEPEREIEAVYVDGNV